VKDKEDISTHIETFFSADRPTHFVLLMFFSHIFFCLSRSVFLRSMFVLLYVRLFVTRTDNIKLRQGQTE